MTQERETQRGHKATATHDHQELTDDELNQMAGTGGSRVTIIVSS